MNIVMRNTGFQSDVFCFS